MPITERKNTSGAPAEPRDMLAANRAIGRLAFEVKASAGMTRRARISEEGPLRIRCPGPPSAELEAVIINTAGGVAGGDALDIRVKLGTDAHAVVTTAAAEKVYRSLDRDATMRVNLAVGARGALVWLPQETILFDEVRFSRAVEIDLASDARLVFAEALIFGRTGMGETVRRGRLFDRWRLYHGGHLLHAEAMRLDGEIAAALARRAVANGALAIATMIIVPAGEAAAADVRALKRRFHGEVSASSWRGMMLVRMCAAEGVALRHDLLAVLGTTGVPIPRLWLN
jgi:urease accessory protein